MKNVKPLIRRNFLLGFVSAGVLMPSSYPRASSSWPARSNYKGLDQRHLWLSLPEGREEIAVPFRHVSALPHSEGVASLRWAFRDWRDDDAETDIDIALLDGLATLQTILTNIYDGPVKMTLISGYRTATRNAGIRGAALNSQHIYGRAADVVFDKIEPSLVASIADRIGLNGVGTYPNFTHIDSGPPNRRWTKDAGSSRQSNPELLADQSLS